MNQPYAPSKRAPYFKEMPFFLQISVRWILASNGVKEYFTSSERIRNSLSILERSITFGSSSNVVISNAYFYRLN